MRRATREILTLKTEVGNNSVFEISCHHGKERIRSTSFRLFLVLFSKAPVTLPNSVFFHACSGLNMVYYSSM